MTPVQGSTTILTRADGSSTWEDGLTKVICSVSGPIEVRLRDEIYGEAAIEVLVRPPIGLPGTKEKHMEGRIAEALRSVILAKLHPRTMIQIVVQFVQGSDMHCRLAAALNAACIALMDAGIPLNGILAASKLAFAGTGVVRYEEGSSLEGISSRHVVCYKTTNGDEYSLLLCESSGEFSPQELKQCLDYARRLLPEENKAIEDIIRLKITRDARWRSDDGQQAPKGELLENL